ncbi:SDR family NAD(P)-dependent oxidoreductase [Maribacter sp. 2307ULW6-5]|uniref:SDR family NAD(P)-dependent oxidoreductase n=1 Tax=Maribacter sp. 2307ULW6-5 TaxID=3386275 RepID=UPI0039BD10EE
MKHGNIIVFGASSGLGKAVAEYLADKCENLFTVSRRDPKVGNWIKTDLTKNEEIIQLAKGLEKTKIDGLLYLGGTWEEHAFTSDYDFKTSTDRDIDNVISVNLIAPIKVVKYLLPNLEKSENAKVVFMGALSGLDNFPSPEVANSSSKFGLRGAVHSLRQTLNSYEIGVTVINAGNIGTPEVLQDLKNSNLDESNAIPIADYLRIIELILTLSKDTTIKEIDLPNTKGKSA